MKNNSQMKILVTGANGFTGKFLCKELKKRKIKFTAVLRSGNDTSWMELNKIQYIFADLNNKKEFKEAINGYEILINLASLGFGIAPSVIKACEKCNIKRVIFISTTGIFTKLNPKSKKIRIEAENLIKESNLNWTIIRPTMIYGDIGDRNLIKLINLIYYFPVIPIFGRGKFLLQPIYVNDLAKAIVDIIQKKNTYFKIFNLSGKNAVSVKYLIKIVALALNKNIYIINFPSFLAIKILTITEIFGIKLPIKREQIERLLEDKNFSHEEAKKEFDYSPINIEDGINKEVKLFLKSKRLK